jgi:hypothetical protein
MHRRHRGALRLVRRRSSIAAAAAIDWVVAGGESGPGARPMHPDWARSLRDQCAAAGVPFFFKQWGIVAIDPEADALVDGMLARARAKQAERCNATWYDERCSLPAGHTDEGHRSASTSPTRDWDAAWSDLASNAKPHVPAAEKPKCEPGCMVCVWCGYRGALDGDAMVEHVQSCTESPLAEANAEVERLTNDRDSWQRCAEEHKAEIQKTNEYFKERIDRLTKERDEARTSGEAMWNQRAAIIQALGIAEDIDMGRDLVDAARALRDRCDVAVDEGVVLRAENEQLTKERYEARRRLAEHQNECTSNARRENERLRAQLATLKAEMLRLVGGVNP